MRRLEVRLLAAGPLIRYLVADFGGSFDGEATVRGEEWVVRFSDGEPVRMGEHTWVPVLFIEIEGPREAEAAAFMRQMTMRGGG